MNESPAFERRAFVEFYATSEGVTCNMSTSEAELAFEEADMANVVARAKALMASERIGVRALAARIAIPEGTLGPFLNGNYAGRPERIVDALTKWMAETADRAEAARQLVAAPPFQKTRTAADVLRALDYAQLHGKMALIALRPGSGKTEACREHCKLRNRVYLATMKPSTSGVASCLASVLAAMGEPDARGTPAALSSRIAKIVHEPGALIILDEANHLAYQAVEELRSIYDQTKCGLAFVGDERLNTLFEATAFAQLRRRVGKRLAAIKNLDQDVSTIATAWGVTEKRMVEFLQRVAAKPGGLGGVTNVMQLAKQLSLAEDVALNFGHLKAAWDDVMPEVAL